MSSTDVVDVPTDLRSWARGMYTTEAASELLIRALNGRFARRGYPWIAIDNGRAWLDVDQISDDTIDAYSGGERRVLALVAALATAREIDLGDIASGAGRENLALILAAIAHAGGSHEHSGMKLDGDGRPVGFIKLTTLYAWPEGDSDAR